MTEEIPQNPDHRDEWQDLIDLIHREAKEPMTEDEAREAARNLFEFFCLSLEIVRESMQNHEHDNT